MVFLLCTAFLFAAPASSQQFCHTGEIPVGRLAAPAHPIPKFVVTTVEKVSECLDFLLRQPRALRREITLEHETVLKQAAPAAPLRTLLCRRTERSWIGTASSQASHDPSCGHNIIDA
ncbi:MAG: hypothetical protein A2V78_11335 [Betaproteobacteria bacterium RBG_16_64_18]|nr:MAG: hypothetical protein A2V78_11335 [Betaproteobacteria bacterium RBG_16_64_18]